MDIISTTCGMYYKPDNATSWNYSHLPSFNSVLPIGNDFLIGTRNGIYKVFQNGTWESQLLFSATDVHSICGRNGLLFAGMEHLGLFKSENSGLNWQWSGDGLPMDTVWGPTGYYYLSHVYNILSLESGLYAGTQKGVYFSANNGAQWTNINQGFPIGRCKHLFFSGGYIFASIDDKLYKTLPSFISWSLAFSGNLINDIAGNETFRLLATESGVFINSNQGTSWVAWNEGLNSSSILSVSMVYDTCLAGTATSGLYYRVIGDPEWQSLNEGIVCSQVGPMDQIGTNIIAGDYRDLYRTDDQGNHWQTISVPQSVRWLTSIAVNNNVLLASMTYPAWPPENAGIYSSSDFGTNWQLASNLTYWDDPYRLYSYQNELYAWENQFLYVSTDQGVHWNDIGYPSQYCNNVNAVYRYDNKLFVGTCNQLLVSTDGGNNYSEVTNGLPENFDVFSLNGEGDFILAYGSYRFFVSLDGGNEWSEITSWNPNKYCYAMKVYDGNIILSSDDGLYLSSNTGHSFVHLPAIRNVAISNLIISGEYLFAGTQNNGVWKRKLSELPLTVNPLPNHPDFNITPNPSEGLFQITVPGENPDSIKLKIQNSRGQVVFNDVLSSKTNMVDLRQFESGLYFVTIISDDWQSTRKVVVL